MAGALVGGALLSATLQVLFDRLASRPVLDFFRGRKFSDSPLKKLEIKLMAIDVVLNDAEEKEITNPSVKKWVDELKDAVYDAEDVVDEIATKALQFKLEAEAHRTSQVRNLSSTSHSIDAEMERKIEEILDRLEYISQQKDVLGLKQVAGWKPSQRLPSTSLVEHSGVFGRDQDKEEIFEMLELDDARADELSVITILGMGGVGKTTLAQLVYNDSKMKDHFDLQAWVCVSEDFDVVRVTKTILEGITFSACDIKDLNILQLKIKESLMGKKFLLVLDDFWNENYNDWDVLQRPFRYGAIGSKVIVTTRSEKVASLMGRDRAHHLDKLSADDCWLLFAKHAFDSKISSGNQELEVVGKRIVAKCNGLPLAAKTLGGLLRSKKDIMEWYNILNSEFWELESDIIPALRLSYHYLPSYLKRCFAYCSIFPKDYEFERQQVILLWMAQDLLHHQSQSKQMEQAGIECFDDLISRSLFQRSSQLGTRFIMHDLVNDLANAISGEFYIRLQDDSSCKITEKTRHLSYLQKQCEASRKFEVLNGAKHLRTFLPLSFYGHDYYPCYLGDKVPNEILSAFTFLRVLSLSWYHSFKELPESIGCLKHLRYMDLSRTAVKRLPNSISTLCNLQTLLLSDCKSLVELPTNMDRLTNLRHLNIRGTNLEEMPVHMSMLTNLQSLSTFIVGKHEGSTIMELREHNNLQGSLDILNLENVTTLSDAIEAKLKDKTHLDELLLQWSEGSEEDSIHTRDVLDKFQPQKKLKKLTIEHYGGTSFPAWLGDHAFSNMVYLCLKNCKYCVSLPPLGQLPSLREIHIIGFHLVTDIDFEFCGQRSATVKPFESLEILEFDSMPEWEQWICSRGEDCSFPSLKELYIKNCPKLKGGIPNHLPSLIKLVISNCQQLAAHLPRAPLVRNVVLDNCDELELSTHNCDDFRLHPSVNVRVEVEVQSSHWSSLQDLKISNLRNLKEVPPWLVQSPAIKKLTICSCPSIKSFPMSGLPTTLECLTIEYCREIELCLLGPDDDIELGNYSSLNLKTLELMRSCDSLKSFPLGLFPQLISLRFWNCVNLSILFIPKEVENNLSSLTSLYLSKCSKLVSFPQGELLLPNLTSLSINRCRSLKSLPQQMHNLLPSLQYFNISNCPKVESFPEGGLPSNLLSLDINNCNKLTTRRRDWGLQSLQKLQDFRINSEEVGESFPEEGLLPSSLTSLSLWSLPNLKNLDKRGLHHLSSLQTLFLRECSNLQCIPKDCLPKSLSTLHILKCPLLEQQCRRDIGEDWPNISHIPIIRIGELEEYYCYSLGHNIYVIRFLSLEAASPPSEVVEAFQGSVEQISGSNPRMGISLLISELIFQLEGSKACLSKKLKKAGRNKIFEVLWQPPK